MSFELRSVGTLVACEVHIALKSFLMAFEPSFLLQVRAFLKCCSSNTSIATKDTGLRNAIVKTIKQKLYVSDFASGRTLKLVRRRATVRCLQSLTLCPETFRSSSLQETLAVHEK